MEEWLKLEFSLHDVNYELILNAGLEKVIKPISFAANILHPTFMGQQFVENEKYNKLASDFFKKNLDKDELHDLAAYKSKTGIFSILKEREIICPKTLWTFAEPNHPSLSELAKYSKGKRC